MPGVHSEALQGRASLSLGMKQALIILLVCSHPSSLAPVPGSCAPLLAIDWVFCFASNLCAEGVVVDTFESYMVRFVWPHYAFVLCLDLLNFAHLAWLVAWISCVRCRKWCMVMSSLLHCLPCSFMHT
jgi:hypothetical protein